MALQTTVKRLRSIACAALALGIAQGAMAQGDAERGSVLADTCKGCHAIENYKNAYPTYYVPKLGGQKPTYVVAALAGYKNGERAHPTMASQATTMSDQDKQDVAAYFATWGEAEAGETVGTAPGSATVCVTCHGENGIAIVDLYPNLAGQHQDYLEVALSRYKSGERSNAIMAAFAATLTEEQISELASYYASQPGLFTIGN